MISLTTHLRRVNGCTFWLHFLCLSLVFCSACSDTGRPAPGTFVIGLESSPSTFDPRLAADAYSSKLCRLIYSGLFRLDKKLRLTPHLLESYQAVSAQEYRFVLRPDVRFQDGSPLTSEDVAWTYNSIREQKVPSPHYSTFSKIAAIEIEDAQRFTIKLKEPFAPFLSALTLGIVRQGKDETLVGSGPFQVSDFVEDEQVILTRFDDYFAGAAKPQQLVFRVIRDDNLRVLDLVRGRIDLLQNNVPAALIPYVRKRKDLVVQSEPGINYSYMGFNLEDPHLSNAKVRRAFAHALNIPEMIRYKLKGMARPATGILAPMHWAYHKPGMRYSYNPQKAMALLDEAGFPDPDGPGPQSRFRILYKTSSKRDRVGMARLISQYLNKVGVDVLVTPYEWGTLFRDIRAGNFQLYTLTWVGVTEPDIYYYVFNSSQIPPKGGNRNRYRNKVIDSLTEAGRSTNSPQERKRIYEEVQSIAADELPYISLWYEDVILVRRRDVKGYVMYPNAAFSGMVGLYREEP